MACLCSVLVNTLSKEGKVDEAVSAVLTMERRGIVGSAALYYDFARCLCSAGRCHEALKQVVLMVIIFHFCCCFGPIFHAFWVSF